MKKIYFLILTLLIISINVSYEPTIEKIINTNKTNNKEIGTIIIPKINLEKPLYSINSKENTIEKNVTILKESIMPNQSNSILFIAAHSGTGKIAYFEELDQLTINDQIIIIYNKKKYLYIVKEIWEEKKNGYINVNKELQKQLVLTTCSPTKKNTQLIINCTLKES
jgi:sortase A